MIQQRLGLTDAETVTCIQENSFVQAFWGMHRSVRNDRLMLRSSLIFASAFSLAIYMT